MKYSCQCSLSLLQGCGPCSFPYLSVLAEIAPLLAHLSEQMLFASAAKRLRGCGSTLNTQACPGPAGVSFPRAPR